MNGVNLASKVLVVDDYNTMVRIIRNLCRQIGFETVDGASSYEEAIGMMRATSYGLVVSGWEMEPMTGYDLLKDIRADASLAKTPFIMVLAERNKDGASASRKLGAETIFKPFNVHSLKLVVDRFEQADRATVVGEK